MRSALAFLLLAWLVHPAHADPVIGPGFDCAKATAPLARLICSNADLSKTDLQFNQAYYALWQQLDPDGRHVLQEEDIDFLSSVLQFCGVPQSGAVAGSPDCVAARYDVKRSEWLARLNGPAREEAIRPIEQHVELQRKLQELGFLPAGVKADGVYRSATRAAILAWQNAHDRSQTGFISDGDAAVLAPPSPAAAVGISSLPAPVSTYRPVQATAYEPASQTYQTLQLIAVIAGFLAIVAVIATVIYLKSRAEKRHRDRINSRVSHTISYTVSTHMRALRRKRFQTLLHDAYGNLVWDPWRKELHYFIETVLEPTVRALGWEEYAAFNSERAAITVLIDQLIEKDGTDAITFGPNLTPVDFEHFCAEQLRTCGWTANTTQASGDQGSDVIAEKNGLRLVVQCKLYNHPVGNKAVQEIAAARSHEQADYAAVVTNTRYTPSAQQLAETNNVLLLHYTDLREIDKYLELGEIEARGMPAEQLDSDC